MPGSTLPNMSLVQGSIAGDVGTWGTIVNNALALVDAHDHTSGKGVRVPVTGLNINGDISFASLHAPTNLHRLSFASIAALSSNNKSLFVSNADNELYWRSNAGTNVKLTSGSSLNVAAFTGGFGGDYVAASAAAAFDDANKNYTFKSSGSAWARATFGGIRLIEFGTTETVRVGLLCPAGLASSYDVTWPLAVPGAKALVQSSTAGVLTFENTGVESVTMATNASVTVSGTGDYKHGDKVLALSAASASAATATQITTVNDGLGPVRVLTSAATTVFVAIPLKTGDRIKSVVFARFGDGAVDITFSVDISTSAGAVTAIGTGSLNNVPNSWGDTTVDVTDTTLAAGETVTLSVVANAGNFQLANTRVTYDRP